MFVKAIDRAVEFTRPLHTISRFVGSTEVHPGAATLFLVNSKGWALTCRHVAELLVGAEEIPKRRATAEAEVGANHGAKKATILAKHGFTKGQVSEIKNVFVGCVDNMSGFELRLHDSLDIALVRFDGFTTLGVSSFPQFAKDGSQLKQGKFLCRLGFPFAEFSNYQYNASKDSIEWTSTGRQDTPRFPLEGMLTRHLIGPSGSTVGFEMSTPGLRGQSGGPAFDTDGTVWGMQAATAHLDLDFDVNQEVQRGPKKIRVKDSAFLHVGHCIHVDMLKAFMDDQGVQYETI